MKRSASLEQKREYAIKYREANRDKIREYARNYYRANREKICARTREIERENKDRFKARKKEWMAKQDPERLKALVRERMRRHRNADLEASREYLRQYRANNKERLRDRRHKSLIVAANDVYIRHLLGFKKSHNIPAELIEAKREHLKLTRTLKNK
jgi:hypothetical protein